MTVNYTPPTPAQLLPVPGVELGTARARIKNWDRDDVVVIRLAAGAQAAGVFTQNRFCAAPVTVCKDHLSQGNDIRALVINAGNANAGTGIPGVEDARKTCSAVAALIGCSADQVLPFATGVIMEPLPVSKIEAALPSAVSALAEANWYAAVRGIMTTDTVPKAASVQCMIDGKPITITGMAKGAGMIAPNMATMLGFIATDAPLAGALLQETVAELAALSFNRITIDGDTSTNDSFILISSGAADIPMIASASDARYATVRAALLQVAQQLAWAIVRDGEGATKFITIAVEQGRDAAECDLVARAIAHSPLVKTAFFASDPNLGRIVCAIGNSKIPDLDPAKVSFYLDDVLVVSNGGRNPAYQEEQGQKAMAKPEILVRVLLNRGHAEATVWTCDLSHDYVSINADYRS